MSDIVIRRFGDLEWSEESNVGDNPAAMLERARAAGYRRKPLLAGEGDVHLTYVEMGPGFVVEPHAHDAAEVLHVLRGALHLDGQDEPVGAGDSVVIPAEEPYGFRCGDDGVAFLILRPRRAGIRHLG